MTTKYPGMALLLVILALLPSPAMAAPPVEATLPLKAVVKPAPPVTATVSVKAKPRVKAKRRVKPIVRAASPIEAIARTAAPVEAIVRAAPPVEATLQAAPPVATIVQASLQVAPPVAVIVSAAPPVETIVRAAAPVDPIVRAAPPVKASAKAAPTVEAVLRAADEARGNVTGLGWEVTIESAENERITDSLMYDIKVRSFNVAGLSLAPPKYRGNKILMLNSNMWFYKPGLSKPVPISLRQKLMGDAAYGDIASTNYAEHYSATRLPDDVVNGKECYVFDLRAKAEKVTYDRIVYWVEKQRQLGIKADYFTVSGKKFKSASMDYGNTIKLDGKPHPFLSRITMHGELLNGAVTYLHLRSPRIEPIPDYVFDLNLFMR